MNQLPVKAIVLLLVIVGFNILFGIDGVALLDPDEPVYAETAKEMIRFNEYLSPRIYPVFIMNTGTTSRRFFTGCW